MPKRACTFDEIPPKKPKFDMIKELEYYSIFTKANLQLGNSKKMLSNGTTTNQSVPIISREECNICTTHSKEYSCQFCEKNLCSECARICQKCIELYCKNCSFIQYGKIDTYICYSCF